MMDCVITEKSALGRLADMHVPRRTLRGASDHFFVVAKVKMGAQKKKGTGVVQGIPKSL